MWTLGLEVHPGEAGLALRAQEAAHRLDQRHAADGLGDDVVGAGAHGAGAVAGILAGDHDDDRSVAQLVVGADLAAQAVAVHARHVQVGDDHGRALASGGGERSLAAVGGVDGAEARQEDGFELPKHRRVVDDENLVLGVHLLPLPPG